MADVEQLARTYSKTRAPDDLEALAVVAWPMALREALRVGKIRNAPGTVDLDQGALEGLSEALKRFSARKTHTFKQFLWLVVKRRVLDRIRLAVGTRRTLPRPAMIHMSALHDARMDKQLQLEIPNKEPSPEVADEVANLFRLQLTPQETLCLRTMLLCDCNFRMTGDIMGVCESRVSQLMTSIRQLARARLKEEK